MPRLVSGPCIEKYDQVDKTRTVKKLTRSSPKAFAECQIEVGKHWTFGMNRGELRLAWVEIETIDSVTTL